MSREGLIIRWRCDICGKTVDVLQDQGSPDKWVWLNTSHCRQKVDTLKDWIVCPTCLAAVQDYRLLYEDLERKYHAQFAKALEDAMMTCPNHRTIRRAASIMMKEQHAALR